MLVPELILVPGNSVLKYGETLDGEIILEYGTNKAHTTWDIINYVVDNMKNTDGINTFLPDSFSKKKKIAFRRFISAVVDGLKPGDSVEIDPDKEFRPLLNQSSMIEGERGTLEAVSVDL